MGVPKPTGLFRGGQCPRQASQLVALPRDLPNRASGSISLLFGRLPQKSSAARGAQAINTYSPGSKKRRATQRRHPSQMPGPPGKRRDATPTSTTSPPAPALRPRGEDTAQCLPWPHSPPLSRARPMVCIAEPTFFADSFRYSLPPYTTTPQQVPGPLRCESASHHMVLRTTSAR